MAESQQQSVEIKPFDDGNPNHSKIIRVSFSYAQESRNASQDRREMNRRNYDTYHLRQDYGHKRAGQSREFLPKQAMAVEQITQFFQQGLLELEDWFRVEYSPGVVDGDKIITNEDIRRLIDRQLQKNNFTCFVGDSIKQGLLGSLMICKVTGKKEKKPFYVTEKEFKISKLKTKTTLKRGEKEYWCLNLMLISPEDYFVDPSGKGLYEMQQAYLDWYEVKKMSEGPDAIYSSKIVDQIPKDVAEDSERRLNEARRTGQNQPINDYRKKVKLQEFWGNILDPDTGEVMHENVVWTIADDRYLIQPPTKNPFWHGESPFVVAPLIRVPGSVWHKALMDAPTRHNIALNELYNLMVDAGMMATYGIKQYRPDWAANDEAFSEGFYPGMTVEASAACPPGGKVLERVDTASMSQESLAMFNLMSGEFNSSALTNDLRMGVMPTRAVKATEVVEASQSITSVFSGIAKVTEETFIEPIITKGWKVTLQHMNDLSTPELQSLLGVDRALALDALSPEERFAESIGKHQFRVFGVSRTLSKMKDFRKLTAFLQTISGSPVLIQEFMQKYDMGRLMDQIMRSLDINASLLQVTDEERQAQQARMQQAVMLAQGNNQGGRSQDGMTADQSQIPQAGGEEMGSLNERPGPGNTAFPPQAMSARGR